jgi:hypothetical protein
MKLITIITVLLFYLSDAMNSKYMVKQKHIHSYKSSNSQNILKSHNTRDLYRESYACQIIKSRQRQHLIEQTKSKTYKPLYIPESKNC